MSEQIYSTKLQDKMERNVFALLLMLMVLLSVGGIVEIVPLFFLHANDREVRTAKAQGQEILWQRKPGETLKDWKTGDGIRPYTPLELAGRAIYIREGCYLCHSQMIRPFRDEKERYGHYSLAAESMYDHPFQWGSKRTGPDLARVGGKYSNDWHRRHLHDPRDVVPESVMPNYPWLEKNMVDPVITLKTMKAMKLLGVPYTDGDFKLIDDPRVGVEHKTEQQAVIAYLQVLGTMAKLDDNVDYRE